MKTARSKIKEKNARVCRVVFRASDAVIYGRENLHPAPPRFENAINSGGFSGLRCFYNGIRNLIGGHTTASAIAQNRDNQTEFRARQVL